MRTMKKIFSILFSLALTTGIHTTADAQRGGHRGSGGGDRRSSPQAGDYRNGGANQNANLNRGIVNRREDGRANAVNTSRVISTPQRRNDVAVVGDRSRPGNYSVVTQRSYRPNEVSTARYSSQRVYNNYQYNNYYRGGYYPHVLMAGPRYRVIPRSFISINFGGYPYYYNNGLFYGSYGGYYQPLFPPPGITIGVLPFGYRRIFMGSTPFFYYNGIYYRQTDQSGYEVVDAPMGATVSALPQGAKSVVLNEERLYELNGTYYKEDRNAKGQTVYTVVGKNGEVNNTNTGASSSVPPPSLNPGDVVNQLPEGSKVVTINGQKLYVTPDDTYLQEQSDNNGVQYKVVGK